MKQYDVSDTIRASIKLASQSIGCTVNELSQAIQRVSETLSKLNISVMTEDGRYKPFGDVYQEVYDKYEDHPDLFSKEEAEEQLRPETSEETEKSNENSPFDFLDENAYDHIEPIFKEDINQDHILNTLDIN